MIIIEVKICGLTNLEDARLAARAGADYLGFILAESPRRLSPDKLAELTFFLKEELSTGNCPELVGVFLNQPLTLINRLAGECQLDYIQLHGRESPEFCRQVNLPVIKAISVQAEKTLDLLNDYEVNNNEHEDAGSLAAADSSAGQASPAGRMLKNRINLNNNIGGYLLDTYYPDKGGGGGESFNWQLLTDRRLQELSRRKKIFLAGGLNPDNIQVASRQPNITGLDVSSGLEKSPGRKDPEKIKKFFNQLGKNPQ